MQAGIPLERTARTAARLRCNIHPSRIECCRRRGGFALPLYGEQANGMQWIASHVLSRSLLISCDCCAAIMRRVLPARNPSR
jgi:hypothetical protein